MLFVRIARFVGGWEVTPLWCLQVFIDHQKSENSQKLIADPLWFHHKSSNYCLCGIIICKLRLDTLKSNQRERVGERREREEKGRERKKGR